MWTIRCKGKEARVCRKELVEILPFVQRLKAAGRIVYVAYVKEK